MCEHLFYTDKFNPGSCFVKKKKKGGCSNFYLSLKVPQDLGACNNHCGAKVCSSNSPRLSLSFKPIVREKLSANSCSFCHQHFLSQLQNKELYCLLAR